jgi:uncharacterized protein YodC (DUF2158 family)
MADTSFEVGTVVMLKSGGPSLTVTKVEKAGITVTWFAEKSEEFKTAMLPANVLFAVDFADDEDEVDDE